MTTANDVVNEWTWRIRQGCREVLTIPIKDIDGNNYSIANWTIDVKIKKEPRGEVIHEFPAADVRLDPAGYPLTLVLQAAVSVDWTFTRAWYRVKVTDPGSPAADLTVERILQGTLIVDLD